MSFVSKMSIFCAFRRNILNNVNRIRLTERSIDYVYNPGSWKMAVFGSCTRTRTQSSYAGLANDKKFLSGYEEIEELHNAEENVHRIFSLHNASQQQKRKVLNKELMKTCNTAKEREIAKMTISIANLEDHQQKMRNKDKHNKVFLQWLKDQRMKKLKSIKTSNFDRYVELIKGLNIEPLESTHTKYNKYKFRRFKIGVEIKEKRSQAVWKMPPLSKQSS